MQKKLKIFPEDWRLLDDERILENLKYIKKHYHKYGRTSPDHLTLRIGNVVFTKLDVTLPSGYISVNRMHLGPSNKESYDIASKIFTSGIKEVRSMNFRGEKIIVPLVRIVGCAFVGGSIVFGGLVGATLGKKIDEKKKAEWAKEVLDSYHQEKIKTDAVNIDSLINQHVR